MPTRDHRGWKSSPGLRALRSTEIDPSLGRATRRAVRWHQSGVAVRELRITLRTARWCAGADRAPIVMRSSGLMKPVVTRAPRLATSAILLLAAGVTAGAAWLAPRSGGAPPGQTAASHALSARPLSSHVLRGTSETQIAITLRAPELERPRQRPPVSLAVVIDRSGSMDENGRMTHAKVAAERLVEQLGPDDELAVITYSTDAETLVPLGRATPDAKAIAAAAIEGIETSGGTNISEGLGRGAAALRLSSGRGARRVVLISDGEANEGIYSRSGLSDVAAGIAAAGASISTVGVGLDFDEQTMTAIAVSGRGHYYFAEDGAELARLFVDELDGLGDTVATHAHLALTPAPGVEVLDVYGYPLSARGQQIDLPIADLRSGEVRKVVVRVRVTAGAAPEMALARVDLGWSIRGRDSEHHVADVRVAVTDDDRAVLAHRDRDVVRQVEEVETARAIDSAAEAYERGDAPAATGILDQRAQEAAAISAEMNDPALADKLQLVTDRAKSGFSAAKPDGSEGARRAVKKSRVDAYELRQ
jgi:Ca-activated chloride channel family protein